jgi:cytochrome c556
MNKHICATFRVLSISTFVAASSLPAASFAASPKAERIAGYKASKLAVAAIKDALQRGDVSEVAEPAEAIATFASRLKSLYPREVGDAFVSPSMEAILKNFPDFAQKADAFAASSRDLADRAVAGSPNPVQMRDALSNVQASCLACHRSYLGR